MRLAPALVLLLVACSSTSVSTRAWRRGEQGNYVVLGEQDQRVGVEKFGDGVKILFKGRTIVIPKLLRFEGTVTRKEVLLTGDMKVSVNGTRIRLETERRAASLATREIPLGGEAVFTGKSLEVQ